MEKKTHDSEASDNGVVPLPVDMAQVLYAN
jgi:hypothetical protein